METALKFLEKPVTSDEKAIASILGIIILAIEEKNAKLLGPLFDDDADIEIINFPGRVFTREEYIRHMTDTAKNIRKIRYDEILIRVSSGKTANVFYRNTIFFISNPDPVIHRRFLNTRKPRTKCGEDVIFIFHRYFPFLHLILG